MGFFDHLNPSKGATFSRDRVYRYSLWRGWNKRLPTLVVIGLNPSTADEFRNDHTISHCLVLAKQWEYGRLVMLNAFAYRSKKRSVLKTVEDPVGPDNDEALLRECSVAKRVIVAWGNDGGLRDRDLEVLDLLSEFRVFCLGTTRSQMPIHPLYVPNSVIPFKYSGRV